MIIRHKIWALALAFCTLAAPALADDKEGMYVFVTGGVSFMPNACNSAWITTYLPPAGGTGTCSQKSNIYRGGFGYQYTPMWGLEANYGTFGYAGQDGTTTNNLTTLGLISYSWQLKALGLAIQGVATVHMTDAFSVFGKFGVARVEFQEYFYGWSPNMGPGVVSLYGTPVVNSVRTAPALGAGIKYDVSPHGSIIALAETFGQHDIYNIYGSTSKVRLLSASVGLMYRY